SCRCRRRLALLDFVLRSKLTDKGPGEGVHNVEVQDLFVLVCKALESDHRIRLHRAPHDSAQNEAERTNAAIGEALATAQKREAERSTLPDINWKEENEVKSLTARQIKICLKQNNLHVSGSKAALVARALDFSHTGTRNNERNSANDSDTELLSRDSEYDSDSHTSTSQNNSDLDDSETDGFVDMRFYAIDKTMYD
ncbi:unnamed protein product, partial [Porites evermanni]